MSPSDNHNILVDSIPIFTRKELFRLLSCKPVDRKHVIELPLHRRIDFVQQIADNFFFPSPTHLDLASAINGLIRYNYLRSDPNKPETWQRLYQKREIASNGIMVGGLSGTGKSTAIRRILALFPTTIIHKNFPCLEGEFKQISSLSFTIGAMPDLRGFVHQLFVEWANVLNIPYDELPPYSVKTKAFANRSIPTFISHCRSHFLGAMHIDEIQSFFQQQSVKDQYKHYAKNSGATKVVKERDDLTLKALLQIYNTAGWGMILSSTPDGIDGLKKRFAVSSRATSSGDFEMPLLVEGDEYTDAFMHALFNYQYVQNKMEINPEVVNFILDSTAGIYRSILKLWQAAHETAFNLNEDFLELKHFQIAYKQHFKSNQILHHAIRYSNQKITSRYLDC